MGTRKELFGGFQNDFVTRVEIAHIDRTERKIHIEVQEDLTGLVELAKVIADEPPGKDFRHAGYIPQSVMDDAFKNNWFHDKVKWKQWLNDPSNKHFRTWPGRV